MSNQPIIFNIEYTPYSLPKNATAKEIAEHKEARAFFDMSGTKNILHHSKKEVSRGGEKRIGVFSEKFRRF